MSKLQQGPLTLRQERDGYAVCACRKDAVSAVIPARVDGCPVTAIDEYAFVDCKSLSAVVLPEPTEEEILFGECLREIGAHAFMRCTSLTAISLPRGVRFVGWGCFHSCEALTSVSCPSDTYFSGYAFAGCSSLSTVTPLESLSEGLFSGCSSLPALPLAPGVTEIPEDCFEHCYALTDVRIPASVTSVAGLAFRSCRALSTITFARSDGWYSENRYDDRTPPVSVEDPHENARALARMDFDDGITYWRRKA